jgi:hypothetical protein
MASILTVLTAAALAAAEPAVPDTLDAIGRVDFLLVQRYRDSGIQWSWARTGRSRDRLGRRLDARCDADRGDVCYADDPDAGRCPNLVQCHPNPGWLVEALIESTRAYPESGYLLGQAVYLLGKLGRVAEALDLAEACRAEPWWCAAMRGYVLHGMVRDAEAYEAMRAALDQAPDSVACALHDATWVLGSWSQRGAPLSVPDARRQTADWDCGRRIAVSDTLWWLADPLYSVPGNDRWVEHVVRGLGARFHSEIRRALPDAPGPREYQDHLHAERVRRGYLDSYETGSDWTSREAARYHFVPDVPPHDLSRPAWRLEGELDDEGYTPGGGPFVPGGGPFVVLPHQVARFRAGDSLLVAAATRIEGSAVARALDAEAALVLTEGPGSPPRTMVVDGRAPIVRFLAQAPERRWIVALEVVTTKGVGWARRTLEPLARGLSDLLLIDAGDPEAAPPADLRGAGARMLGSTSIEPGAGVGIYWEVYDVPRDAELQVELSVERAGGGLVERLRRMLPGGAEEGRGRVAWRERVSAPTHRSAVALDLGNLDAGAYELVLRVGWGGREPLERRRAITVR